MFEVDAMTGI